MNEFSHYNDNGSATMVDISEKKITLRKAKAAGFVRMQPKTLHLIREGLIPKGNPFEAARFAGIMTAKRTAELIPMCHPLLLTHVDIKLDIDDEKCGISITSEVRLEGKTGAEMEALSAVSIAALTVYDMCKAVDKNMIIEDMRLIEKSGGKSDVGLS
ncbi:MAG: cyclic pyranopterin monophosphate synthase MoaC [Spirochaetota bacterium]|nr:cyclic pyranopterin monophosphate synthase MoaC [Spirochaetota bacterium]